MAPRSLRRRGRRPCTPKKYLVERSVERVAAEDALPRRGRLPSTRRIAWLLVRAPGDLSDTESVVLAHVRQDAEVAALVTFGEGLR